MVVRHEVPYEDAACLAWGTWARVRSGTLGLGRQAVDLGAGGNHLSHIPVN